MPSELKLKSARGRPMLTWVGKRPLSYVRAFPAQHIETFDPAATLDAPAEPGVWQDWPDSYPRGGLLFHGDNKDVLAHLLANGFREKVKLIYIDPPFDSGADYVRRVNLRGASGSAKLDGESYTLGEQIQYEDIWANDNYLQFMYERLMLLNQLLTEDGSLYLHCDQRKSHHIRCILDEIFGANSFVSEIVWQSSDAQSSANRYGPIHNTIFYYAKGGGRIWNEIRTPLSRSTDGQPSPPGRGRQRVGSVDRQGAQVQGSSTAELPCFPARPAKKGPLHPGACGPPFCRPRKTGAGAPHEAEGFHMNGEAD